MYLRPSETRLADKHHSWYMFSLFLNKIGSLILKKEGSQWNEKIFPKNSYRRKGKIKQKKSVN